MPTASKKIINYKIKNEPALMPYLRYWVGRIIYA
jgi:hypothetical protein